MKDHTLRYTPRDLGDRLGDPSHPSLGFLREVLSGGKIWVAGSSSELAPIVAAAGVHPSGTGGSVLEPLVDAHERNDS